MVESLGTPRVRKLRKPRFQKVKGIKPGMTGLNLLLKCVSCTDIETKSELKFREAVLGDETGIVKYHICEEHQKVCTPGASIRVQNACARRIDGSMRLIVDKWGVLKAADSVLEFEVDNTDIHVIGNETKLRSMEREFEFRRLKDKSELETWYDLLVAVYGHMGLHRPYFKRHWESDAGHDLAGISVAVDRKTGKMVSTNRVFTRHYRIRGGETEIIGGIGEVCTLPKYTKRGLATRLLRMALEYMTEKGMKWSSLHAYSSGGNIYRRLGWKPVPMRWHNIPITVAAPNPEKCRPLDIEGAWDDILLRITPLREHFSIDIDGYVRSPEYWRTWVRYPAEALDAKGEPAPGLMRGWELLRSNGTTQAYLIAKSVASFSAGAEAIYAGETRHGMAAPLNLTILDFAATATAGSKEAEADFLALLAAARDNFAGPSATATASVPQKMAPSACVGAPENTEQSTWMYCDVATALAKFGTDKSAASDPFAQRIDPEAHLVFSIDEF